MSARKGSGDYGRTETFSNDLMTKTRMTGHWAIIRVFALSDLLYIREQICVQAICFINVGLIDIFDSSFFGHGNNQIFIYLGCSQANNDPSWNPLYHCGKIHFAICDQSPFFIIFVAFLFNQAIPLDFPRKRFQFFLHKIRQRYL